MKSNRSQSSSTFEPCCCACDAEIFLQRVMQDVRRRVGPANARPRRPMSTLRFTLRRPSSSPLLQVPVVNDQPAVLLRIGHVELEPSPTSSPVSPTWPPLSP